MFFDTAEWFKWNEQYDFSMGARIHGNVANMLAGVPSLTLTYDTRVKEICDHFHLPQLPISEVNKIQKPEEVKEYIDYDEFYRSYDGKLEDYVEFMHNNQLSLIGN